MSTDTVPKPPTDDESNEEWLQRHRDALEREANSDAPDAWVFERVLQSMEDGDS